MKYLLLDNYLDFKCIGDKCPDTCCAGWAISVDGLSAQKYREVSGAFGDKLRENLFENNGKIFFQLINNRCAFLRDDNLCEIYRELGEEALCNTCEVYPRIVKEYGDLSIGILTVSCPEVARQLLEHTDSIMFDVSEIEEAPDAEGEIDWEVFNALITGLTDSIRIMQDERRSIPVRLRCLLLYNEALQEIIRGKGDAKAFSGNFFSDDFYQSLCGELPDINCNYSEKLQLLRQTIQSATIDELIGKMGMAGKIFAEAVMEHSQKGEVDFGFEKAIKPEYAKWYENFSVYFLIRNYLDALKKKNPLTIVEELVWMINLWQGFIATNERYVNRSLLREEHIFILSRLSRLFEHCEVVVKRVREEVLSRYEEQTDYWLGIV